MRLRLRFWGFVTIISLRVETIATKKARASNRTGKLMGDDVMTKYLTVKEFLVLVNGKLSRNSVYQAIARNELPHLKIGRKILIPEDALDRLLDDDMPVGA